MDKEKLKKAILWGLAVFGILLIATYFLGIGIYIDSQKPGSLPWYCYIRVPYKTPFRTEILPGDYIAFRADRRMLPYFAPGVIFGKRVVGVSGDHLEVRGREFYLNGRLLTRARETDSQGNPAPLFTYNGTIPQDCYFVLGHHYKSFDSRYWGFVCRGAVVGRLVPLGFRKY